MIEATESERSPPEAAIARSGRHWAAYGLVLLAVCGIVVLVAVVGAGVDRLVRAPEVLAVGERPHPCLGRVIVLEQSGVYLEVWSVDRRPDRGGSVTGGSHVGERLGRGRVEETGRITLEGTCARGTDLAGRRFTGSLALTPGERGDAAVATGGHVEVDGERHRVWPSGPVHIGSSSPGARLAGSELMTRTLLAIVVVLVAARLAGSILARLWQPRVIGEIVAGIVLGPSALGAAWPAADAFLFPPEVTEGLRVVAHLGLVLFMFLVGVHLDLSHVAGAGRTAVLVSHASIAAPFLLGVGLAFPMYRYVGSGPFVPFALFLGVAMSITAFPVLARIVSDTGLDGTRLGTLAITCAAVDDVTAWCALSVVMATAHARGAGMVVEYLALTSIFVLVVVVVVRPLAGLLERRAGIARRVDEPVLATLVVGVLVAAWVAEQIGMHAVFGAFAIGAVLPGRGRLAAAFEAKVADLTAILLLPAFFAVVGLVTRIDLLDRTEFWIVAGAVLVVAVLGKWGASTSAARASGLPWSESAALGALMNARGLTEIIILTVGLELGVVSPVLFAVMVLMALATTAMASPAVRLWRPQDSLAVDG